MYLLLIRTRVRLWWYGVVRGKDPARRILGLIAVAIVITFLWLLLYATSIVYFRDVEDRHPATLASYAPVAFAVLMLFTFVGCLRIQVHQLYLASDLDLLMAAPIPARTLFLVKLTESAPAVALPLLAGVAVLAGYGAVTGATPAFYALTPPLIAAVAVPSGATAMVALMLLTRFIPPRYLRTALTLFGVLAGVGVWLAFRGVSPGAVGAKSDAVSPAVGRWGDSPILGPALWAADLLRAVEAGDAALMARSVLLLGVFAAAVLAISSAVFRQTFYAGFGRLREASPARRRRARGYAGRLPSPLSPPLRAIVVKEWRTLLRDVRLLSALIVPVAMSFITLFWPGGRSSGAGPVGTLFVVPFVLYLVALGLPAVAVGREGRNFALLWGAPITVRQVIAGKSLAYIVAAGTLTGTLVLIVGLLTGTGAAEIGIALAMAAWLSTVTMTTAVAAGAIAPKFDADNPQRAIGCTGQIWMTVVDLFTIGAGTGFFLWLTLLIRGDAPVDGMAAGLIALLLAACVAATAGLVWLLVRQGEAHLAEWEAD
jgi:hypothetical protein